MCNLYIWYISYFTYKNKRFILLCIIYPKRYHTYHYPSLQSSLLVFFSISMTDSVVNTYQTLVLCSSRAGYIKYTVPLNLTKYMSNEDEYVPLAAVSGGTDYISSILPQSSPAFKYLKVSSHANALVSSPIAVSCQGHPTTIFCKLSVRRSKYCLV